MEKIWKKWIKPLLIILGGSLILSFITSANWKSPLIVECIKTIIFFSFGMTLNPRRRNAGWVGKLIISFLVFFTLLYNLSYLHDILILRLIGIERKSIFVYSIQILCGFLFFD